VAKRTNIRPVAGKSAKKPSISTEHCKQVWIFESVDRDGHFSFTPNKMDCADVLDKIIHYSAKTWSEIKSEKYGDGKSKHHYL